jgi:hypothetical protein
VIEEVMPSPQKQFAVRDDDAPDPLDFARIVSLVIAQAYWNEPKRRTPPADRTWMCGGSKASRFSCAKK